MWESAAACMRNWLILREKVRAFRADPEVQDALRQAKLDELARPTLADGEDWRSVRDATADAGPSAPAAPPSSTSTSWRSNTSTACDDPAGAGRPPGVERPRPPGPRPGHGAARASVGDSRAARRAG